MDFGSALYYHCQFFWKFLKLKQILKFLKNGPWPYFKDNSYEIYYLSLIEFSWVWAWSLNFNFFSNEKRGLVCLMILLHSHTKLAQLWQIWYLELLQNWNFLLVQWFIPGCMEKQISHGQVHLGNSNGYFNSKKQKIPKFWIAKKEQGIYYLLFKICGQRNLIQQTNKIYFFSLHFWLVLLIWIFLSN